MEGPMNLVLPLRKIAHRTRGYGHGPIVRLMSPSDLGEELKPFVFLDLFEADMRNLAGSMPVHPHSGIATVTVFTTGDVTFDDPHLGHGTIGYGGVEWVRAGRGMWHGKELSAGSSAAVQGFQLWIALPPDLENAEPEVQYVGTGGMPIIGPARLIVGAYARRAACRHLSKRTKCSYGVFSPPLKAATSECSTRSSRRITTIIWLGRVPGGKPSSSTSLGFVPPFRICNCRFRRSSPRATVSPS